jgi:hypothetical protein
MLEERADVVGPQAGEQGTAHQRGDVLDALVVAVAP